MNRTDRRHLVALERRAKVGGQVLTPGVVNATKRLEEARKDKAVNSTALDRAVATANAKVEFSLKGTGTPGMLALEFDRPIKHFLFSYQKARQIATAMLAASDVEERKYLAANPVGGQS